MLRYGGYKFAHRGVFWHIMVSFISIDLISDPDHMALIGTIQGKQHICSIATRSHQI